MLADLIKQHALADAQAGDWAKVATTIRGLGLRAAPRLCYSVESGDAIEAAGDDPATVLGWMTQDPNGTMLFQRLSSSAGVEWAHVRTQQWLTWFVSQNRISQAGANALVDLSSPLTYQDLTGEQCQAEWQAQAARESYEAIRTRRQAWDIIAAEIRSEIGDGRLIDDAGIIAAVQSKIGA